VIKKIEAAKPETDLVSFFTVPLKKKKNLKSK
jgi:hypothetical protein